jgi:WD40 repeat protein/flagellar biosynthesis/type III secretory pathway chaperone
MGTKAYSCLLFLILFAVKLFAQQPEFVFPVGQTGPVQTAKFSHKGKFVLTISDDNSAKIWETKSGKLLHTLTGHLAGIVNSDIRFDDSLILTGSQDNKVLIWNAITGEYKMELNHLAEITTCLFSPDGKRILTSARDGKAIIWSAVTGEQLIVLPHNNWVTSANFSANGKFVITSAIDSGAFVWDSYSGKLLYKINSHAFYSEFSPDGKLILAQQSYQQTAKIYDATSQELIKVLEGHDDEISISHFSPDGSCIATASRDGSVKIWKSSTGELLNTLTLHTGWIVDVNFSPDSKFLITAAWDNTASIWEVETGKLSQVISGHKNWVQSASFSSDGNYIVTTSLDNTARLWERKSGKLHSILSGLSSAITGISLSHDGKSIMTNSEDGIGRFWDIKTGQILFITDTNSLSYSKSYFSPNDNYLLTFSQTKPVSILNSVTGKAVVIKHDSKDKLYVRDFLMNDSALITIDDKSNLVIRNIETTEIEKVQNFKIDLYEAKISNNGVYLAMVKKLGYSSESSAEIWDIKSNKLLYQLNPSESPIHKIMFSNDSKLIGTLTKDGRFYIWQTENGNAVREITSSKPFSNIWFTENSRSIFGTSEGPEVSIWDIKTGNNIYKLKGGLGEWGDVYLTPAGNELVLSYRYLSKIIVWDIKTNAVIKEFVGNNFLVDSSGKILVVVKNSEQTVYDLHSHKILYHCIPIKERDYITYDSVGHFDGTEAARKLLYFTCGSEIIELEQVKDKLWVPNLAERIMNGEPINSATLADLEICGLTPEVELIEDSGNEYFFLIKPRKGGLGETVLYVNGIEAKRYKPIHLKKINDQSYELRVTKDELKDFFIAGQENPVTLKAYNFDNTISSRGAILVENKTKIAKSPPNLYAIMVGVSDYKGEELDLKYAAKDASDLSNAVALSARKLLNTDGKEHVFIYNLTTSSDHYLLPEKNSIKNTFAEIGKKANSNDILLIFFAGHGVMQGEKKQFYFLTADASKTSAVQSTSDVGISSAELSEWMKPQNIKAQKRILIFDACNSGQAINDLVKIGTEEPNEIAARNDDKAQQIITLEKLNEKTGLFILSASASNQSAYELSRYSQGLLTYSLLKAIKLQSDILEDGKYLNINRWFNASEKIVTELCKENGARQEPQIVSQNNFNIGIVDQEVMAGIVLPQEKPMFSASNFQNADENIADDNLELNKLINQQLNDISSRGENGKIVFLSSTNSPDAYSLSGRYTVNGNIIKATVNIKKNKVIVSKFEQEGTTDNLSSLAKSIAVKASEIAK